MKRFLLFFLLPLLARGQGSWVTTTFQDSGANARNINVVFTPLSTPILGIGPSIYSLPQSVIATNGFLAPKFLYSGNYAVTFGPQYDKIFIGVTNNLTTNDLFAAQTNFITIYTNLSFLTFNLGAVVAGTNVTVTTNINSFGVVYYTVSSTGGSGSATNLPSVSSADGTVIVTPVVTGKSTNYALAVPPNGGGNSNYFLPSPGMSIVKQGGLTGTTNFPSPVLWKSLDVFGTSEDIGFPYYTTNANWVYGYIAASNYNFFNGGVFNYGNYALSGYSSVGVVYEELGLTPPTNGSVSVIGSPAVNEFVAANGSSFPLSFFAQSDFTADLIRAQNQQCSIYPRNIGYRTNGAVSGTWTNTFSSYGKATAQSGAYIDLTNWSGNTAIVVVDAGWDGTWGTAGVFVDNVLFTNISCVVNTNSPGAWYPSPAIGYPLQYTALAYTLTGLGTAWHSMRFSNSTPGSVVGLEMLVLPSMIQYPEPVYFRGSCTVSNNNSNWTPLVTQLGTINSLSASNCAYLHALGFATAYWDAIGLVNPQTGLVDGLHFNPFSHGCLGTNLFTLLWNNVALAGLGSVSVASSGSSYTLPADVFAHSFNNTNGSIGFHSDSSTFAFDADSSAGTADTMIIWTPNGDLNTRLQLRANTQPGAGGGSADAEWMLQLLDSSTGHFTNDLVIGTGWKGGPALEAFQYPVYAPAYNQTNASGAIGFHSDKTTFGFDANSSAGTADTMYIWTPNTDSGFRWQARADTDPAASGGSRDGVWALQTVDANGATNELFFSDGKNGQAKKAIISSPLTVTGGVTFNGGGQTSNNAYAALSPYFGGSSSVTYPLIGTAQSVSITTTFKYFWINGTTTGNQTTETNVQLPIAGLQTYSKWMVNCGTALSAGSNIVMIVRTNGINTGMSNVIGPTGITNFWNPFTVTNGTVADAFIYFPAGSGSPTPIITWWLQ